LVLCLLSLTLMTVWTKEGPSGPLHQARSGFQVMTLPLKTAGSFLATPFRAVGEFVTGVFTDAATVQQLREQNEQLQSQLIQMEEFQQENERLAKLLDLKDAFELESVGARVISKSPDSWNRTITINKGSVAGFEVGMPVISPNGLIGQIENVSLYSSEVRLITDSQSGVAAILQSNRAEGIVSGSVDGVLYLKFIPMEVAVQPGDVVITSGAGGIFPKGIPIGEVLSVQASPSDVSRTIVVKPIARVSAYEEVLVVIGSEAQIGIGSPGSVTAGGQDGAGSNAGADGASGAVGGGAGTDGADGTGAAGTGDGSAGDAGAAGGGSGNNGTGADAGNSASDGSAGGTGGAVGGGG
jgi:rod shape-determining protein MreC